MRRWFVALLVLVLLTACVSPSRTDRDFELKAGNSAKAAASAVATALLGVEAAAEHKAFGPYLSVLLGSAEKDAESVQAQFGSVQPPSEHADRVRAVLGEQLSAAVEGLQQLRIAVRRGELDRLEEVAEPLEEVLEELRALSEEWQ